MFCKDHGINFSAWLCKRYAWYANPALLKNFHFITLWMEKNRFSTLQLLTKTKVKAWQKIFLWRCSCNYSDANNFPKSSHGVFIFLLRHVHPIGNYELFMRMYLPWRFSVLYVCDKHCKVEKLKNSQTEKYYSVLMLVFYSVIWICTYQLKVVNTKYVVSLKISMQNLSILHDIIDGYMKWINVKWTVV